MTYSIVITDTENDRVVYSVDALTDEQREAVENLLEEIAP